MPEAAWALGATLAEALWEVPVPDAGAAKTATAVAAVALAAVPVPEEAPDEGLIVSEGFPEVPVTDRT